MEDRAQCKPRTAGSTGDRREERMLLSSSSVQEIGFCPLAQWQDQIVGCSAVDLISTAALVQNILLPFSWWK
ncbi:hypothetical protein EYF80_019644 [Liparis tanakae]|uniref:Uncharacterized protein n=1 Tax=Liparis tanakae TaxID=230148 RepID=A0A4Z2HYT4_9TELE|nr:hypothetical protein EYF80_019644 [Liparis tanakae]